MVLPYDPTKGKKPSKAQLRDAEKHQVGCERVRVMGPPVLGYLAFFDDADRRAAEGQVQTKCGMCNRYRWEDEASACSDFRPEADR